VHPIKRIPAETTAEITGICIRRQSEYFGSVTSK